MPLVSKTSQQNKAVVVLVGSMAVVITSICVLQEPSSLCKVLFWQLSSKPASATSWHCENYPFTIHTCVSCVPFRVWTLWTIVHAWESQAKSYGITGNWSANLRQILLQNMSCTSIPVKTWLMIVCKVQSPPRLNVRADLGEDIWDVDTFPGICHCWASCAGLSVAGQRYFEFWTRIFHS